MTDVMVQEKQRLPLFTEYRILLDILLIAGQSDREFVKEELRKLDMNKNKQKLKCICPDGILIDALCPIHGREAMPEAWETYDSPDVQSWGNDVADTSVGESLSLSNPQSQHEHNYSTIVKSKETHKDFHGTITEAEQVMCSRCLDIQILK